jgi:hypothetical protein
MPAQVENRFHRCERSEINVRRFMLTCEGRADSGFAIESSQALLVLPNFMAVIVSWQPTRLKLFDVTSQFFGSVDSVEISADNFDVIMIGCIR